ncbi:FadR/GntR family transcriptional regulator [Paenibacillus eucommiae]|uniref:GntR family transcriptional repressor for pyruvate dehydrogenase complex n=1 Tax=Paenibacillus eucommiae TaxID=1355755 RepID=A0ABS4J283_9BACL|nr:FadR/GntR family transcriptional regulator [Paenibacillus eucommiae]MBP1993951.1 GntR family transcriptional repressor for pyruvate dehydrogenase complex [Paenibacillus eucommiae]
MDMMQRNLLSQMASEQIKKYITDRQLNPGDQLPTERELAEKLQVSRTVVREALNQLETLGMIVKIQGKGVFIAERNLTAFFQQIVSLWGPGAKQDDQLVGFRMMLELAALDYIVINAKEQDYEELRHIVANSQNADISLAEFVQYDYDFHRQLLKLTNNDLFDQLVSVIHDYFRLILHTNEGRKIDRNPTIRDHLELLQLLQDGHLEEAKQLLRKHLIDP